MTRRWLFGSLLCVALGCERAPTTPGEVAPAPAPSPSATSTATAKAPVATASVAPIDSPATAAPAPVSRPRLLGDYVGDRLRLTLTGAGDTRGGTLRIRGRSFPLTARRIGDRLEGSFTVEGKAFPFHAVARGAGLDLTADDRTYRLAPPTGVDPWAGRFQSDDQGSLLVLERTRDALRGRIEAAGVRYALVGTVRDDAARGTLTDRRTGQDHSFRATRKRTRLTFVVQTRAGDRTSLRTLIFQRR